jgi:hypothetical protein
LNHEIGAGIQKRFAEIVAAYTDAQQAMCGSKGIVVGGVTGGKKKEEQEGDGSHSFIQA